MTDQPRKKKVVVSKGKKTKRAKSTPSSRRLNNTGLGPVDLIFNKGNFMYMLIGIGLIALGFLLMTGGSMPDDNTWDESIIYSTRRTLIAPIFILTGLGIQFLAIFRK